MDIERKYNRGAKIVLFISILAIPMQLITTALISRISSEASGTLGLLEIFYNGVIAFFMLGGETGIIKLLTNKGETDKKKIFIIKYMIVCILFFLVLTLGLRIFNIDIIQMITGQEESTSYLMYFAALFVIMNNILLAYIKESEKFIHYAIGIKLFNIGNLIAILYVFFIAKDSNIQNILLVFMGLLQLINVIYIIIKEKIFSKVNIQKHGKIDLTMFKYLFFLYLSMILVFVYDKIDQIIVVNKLGLSILGGYYLVVKVVNMVKLLPNIYNSTFYPYICKTLKKENANFILNHILNKNLMFIYPLTIIVVLNSNLIISILFGTEYLSYSVILQILTSIVLFSSPTQILNNFLYAVGDSKKYFIISFLSVMLQVILITALIDKFGLIIVVIARGASTLLILLLCMIGLNKMGYKMKLDKNYYIDSAITILLLIVTNILKFSNIVYVVVTIVLLSIFVFKNREYLLNLLPKHKINILEKNENEEEKK